MIAPRRVQIAVLGLVLLGALAGPSAAQEKGSQEESAAPETPPAEQQAPEPAPAAEPGADGAAPATPSVADLAPASDPEPETVPTRPRNNRGLDGIIPDDVAAIGGHQSEDDTRPVPVHETWWFWTAVGVVVVGAVVAVVALAGSSEDPNTCGPGVNVCTPTHF